MDIINSPLVCVDIETNGMSARNGHILEVAALRIEDGKIVDQFSTLLNPGIAVPYFITQLTGITTDDIQGAPTFAQVSNQLHRFMDGAIFVAHNVSFDYSFLQQEFERVGIMFVPRKLCTVKLSRRLYPNEKSHKLSSLIERHGFSYSARHRAYDDAHVLYQFLSHVNKQFDTSTLADALRHQLM